MRFDSLGKPLWDKLHHKLLSRSVRKARVWSNAILRKHASLVHGKVVNVSGWEDKDKQGRCYRDYFVKASGYEISNFEGWRGLGDNESINLDLTSDLPGNLTQAFDCVFNHTTLEHIFEVRAAFSNICALSRDVVILVVPAVQPTHGPENGDFWRFTPYCVRKLFQDNGFDVVAEHYGPIRGRVKYLYYFSARDAQPWHAKLQESGCRQDVVAESERLAW